MTTIICLGNEMRGDDGAGVAVAERLRARGVSVLVEQATNLLDAWSGAGEVVVVDAVQSGASPGTVHRIDALQGPLPPAWASASTHLLGLAEVIELGRALDRLPDRLLVIGIEGRSYGCGDLLSAEVERAVRSLADELDAGRP